MGCWFSCLFYPMGVCYFCDSAQQGSIATRCPHLTESLKNMEQVYDGNKFHNLDDLANGFAQCYNVSGLVAAPEFGDNLSELMETGSFKNIDNLLEAYALHENAQASNTSLGSK